MPSRTSSEASKDSAKDSTCGFPLPRTNSHHAQLTARKTEIKINVYDLLPPGKLSTILWTIGSGLLHSGVVIGDREYAYGGHDRRGLTGVYYTKPKQLPPGGTFRIEILQGFTLRNRAELEEVIHEVSEAFQGTAYNLLTKNCNHFTSYLVQRLTGRPAPKWLNRAAGIGVALPCVVPRDWITPPEYEDVDGELLDDEESEDYDERSRMMRRERDRRQASKASAAEEEEWSNEVERMGRGSMSSAESSRAMRSRYTDSDDEPPRLVKLKDAGGGNVPPAERAPLPRTRR